MPRLEGSISSDLQLLADLKGRAVPGIVKVLGPAQPVVQTLYHGVTDVPCAYKIQGHAGTHHHDPACRHSSGPRAAEGARQRLGIDLIRAGSVSADNNTTEWPAMRLKANVVGEESFIVPHWLVWLYILGSVWARHAPLV